jgi:2-phospho-L-lactate guanylyltransferase (CobY/MobA/RfbA family)
MFHKDISCLATAAITSITVPGTVTANRTLPPAADIPVIATSTVIPFARKGTTTVLVAPSRRTGTESATKDHRASHTVPLGVVRN